LQYTATPYFFIYSHILLEAKPEVTRLATL